MKDTEIVEKTDDRSQKRTDIKSTRRKIKKSVPYKLFKNYSYTVMLIITFAVIAPFICYKLAVGSWNTHKPVNTAVTTKPQDKALATEPQTEAPKYVKTTSGSEYFDDALFIGDSRTQGICEFSGLNNATYFAYEGMNIYKVYEEEINVSNIGKTSLPSLLTDRKFGKIYIMLGLNEIGYNLDSVVAKYSETLDKIRAAQPDALIYIEANQHVTADEETRDPEVSNAKLDELNGRLSKFADGKKSFYIDVNEIFDDQNGKLDGKYTYDGVHIMANYYKDWADWLCTQTMVENTDKTN